MQGMRTQIADLSRERDALLAQSASPTEDNTERLLGLEKALSEAKRKVPPPSPRRDATRFS